MALRLIEVLLPSVAEKRVKEVFERIHGLGVWQEYLTEKQISIRLLVPSEETQDVLDVLEKEFSMVDGFRVLVTPVEAILPRQESVEASSSKLNFRDSVSDFVRDFAGSVLALSDSRDSVSEITLVG